MKLGKQREYSNLLKSNIVDFTTNFKKRYKIFPWTKINKLTKTDLKSEKKLSLHGKDYTVLSLVKEINMMKKSIEASLKPNYFNHYIVAFNKECRSCKSDTEFENVYKSINEELELEFKQIENNFMFCLDGLKEINKALNKQDIETPVEESALKSTLDTDYQSKGTKSLKEFRKVEIDKFFIKKYTPRTKLLKSVERGEFGYAWIDNDDDLVGYVMCNKDGWITAVEITGEYRGYGISRQLMIYAMKHMGGNRLGVHKDNKIALNLYRQLGFKVVPAEEIGGSGDKNMIFMLRAGTKTNNVGKNQVKESEDIKMFEADKYLEMMESELFEKKFDPESYLESVMNDIFEVDPKQAVYEACSRGEITVEEREEIIANMDNQEYLEENTDDIFGNDDLAGCEKYDKIRKVLYEKCSNGEITVNNREALLKKAHEMIFAVESDSKSVDLVNEVNPIEEGAAAGKVDTTKEMAKASVDSTKKIAKELNSTLNSNAEQVAKKINA